jgi:uncharacterized protein
MLSFNSTSLVYKAMTTIRTFPEIFSTRLDMLDRLIDRASEHFNDDENFLGKRLIEDMHPLGTQVAFTCNQPRNFALWSKGQSADNIDPDVQSVKVAKNHIQETKRLLLDVTLDDSAFTSQTRIGLSPGLYAEMTGHQYINDFLFPNFYFHLVTAYNILRMAGVQIGKRDYMLHLIPHVRQE